MLKIKDMVLQPTSLLILVPKVKTKVQLLNTMVDPSTIFPIIKIGKLVTDFIEVEVGDGAVIEAQRDRPIFTLLNNEDIEQDYLLMQAHEIMYGVKNIADYKKIDKKVEPTIFADPNITSTMLDHVATSDHTTS